MGDLGFFFATLNAILNATAAVFLMLGFYFIRTGNRDRHQKFMVSAFVTSIVFLLSYLTRFYLTGVHRYEGEGWVRVLYLTILGTHTVLAAVTPVLAIVSLRLGFKKNFSVHKKWARWTFPIWLYVSVTGVVIYFMLYH